MYLFIFKAHSVQLAFPFHAVYALGFNTSRLKVRKENISKKVPKKANLEFAVVYHVSMYIVFTAIYMSFTFYWYSKLSRDDLKYSEKHKLYANAVAYYIRDLVGADLVSLGLLEPIFCGYQGMSTSFILWYISTLGT